LFFYNDLHLVINIHLARLKKRFREGGVCRLHTPQWPPHAAVGKALQAGVSKQHLLIILLIATGRFGGKKALFSSLIVKFFAEYARFRLQNLP